MKNIKSLLKILFDLGYIDKKSKEKYNYELLTRMIKKKERSKLKYIESRKKEVELEMFMELIKEDKHNYSNKELIKILDTIEENKIC